MFLNRYRSSRKLGKGAYGDVYLVEDLTTNIFYALKLISVQMIDREPHLRDYLDGQIQCMRAMNSPYIIKLYQKEEDETNIYLLLQYCDGGDLINYQAKLQGKVFALNKALEVLSEVILGLEHLHKQGYLHRDIKSQNVLAKTQNGKTIFKLADFGFSKKNTQAGGTVLGTEHFMSPQIYRSQIYGFEVDMWAFGVLLYFMLNMQFPFKLNPHLQIEKKQAQLLKLAKNFSYRKFVEKTRKKILDNCTPLTEDLFQKIFELDPEKRITFSQIRSHPVFQKYFPQVTHDSKILYGTKFQSKIVKKTTAAKIGHYLNYEDDNIRPTHSVIKIADKKYPKEKEFLDKKKDQIDFLKDTAQQFMQVGQILKKQQKLMLCFNLFKYYIVLVRNFKAELNAKVLAQKCPNLKWAQFVKTQQFSDVAKQATQDCDQIQRKFQDLHEECSYVLDEIENINPKFRTTFDKEIEQTKLDGAFKESYRKSTIFIFGVLRESLKANRAGNKLNYFLSLLVISHAFNNIFGDLEHVKTIFQLYFEERKKDVSNIDYSELREWMTKSSREVLNNIAKSIIKIYFQA